MTNIAEINSCFIDTIKLKNFYSIKEDIELTKLNDKSFIFLLGENGSGKTIVLKAILIALKKQFINNYTNKTITGIIEDILSANKNFEYSATAYQDINKDIIDEFSATNQVFLKNIYAYGTNRHKVSRSSESEEYGFMTLFKDDEYLINTEAWIKEIERKELKKVKTITIKQVQDILQKMLDIDDLQIVVKDEKESKVVFTVNEYEYQLKELSEGYQSIITFVIDLLARLSENNPDIYDTKEIKAIVLIDELDMFLHPTWEKTICEKLAEWFPNIQFFITTHSPVLIEGASKSKMLVNDKTDKVQVYRIKNVEQQTQIVKTYTGEEVKNLTTFDIINSKMFDDEYIELYPPEYFNFLNTAKTVDEMIKANNDYRKLREMELKKLYINGS